MDERPLPSSAELPSPESLRCALAGARRLSFRAAAADVGLTPQAFSARIAALEAQLGLPLFERTTRKVRITAAGLRFVPRAEAALEALRLAGVGLAEGDAPPPTTLRLGTRHELGLSWLEPAIPGLKEGLPWLTVDLAFGAGAELIDQVARGLLDGAVTSARLDDVRLVGLELHVEAYAFVAAPALLAKRPLESERDAARHVLVDIDGSLPLFRYWRDAHPGHVRWRFTEVRGRGTIEAVRRAVARGEGVAVLPSYFVAPDLRRRKLVSLFPSRPPREDAFRLVVRADDARLELFQRLAAALRTMPLR